MLIWKNLKKNGRLNYIPFVLMIQYLGEFNARNRFVLMKDRLLVFKIIKIQIYLLLDITYSLIHLKHYTFYLLPKEEYDLWINYKKIHLQNI